MRHALLMLAMCATAGLVACAVSGVGDPGVSEGTTTRANDGGATPSSSSTSPPGTPCTTCTQPDAGGAPAPAGDDESPAADGGAPETSDDAAPGTPSTGLTLPPITLPDADIFSSPPPADDGGASSCHTKVCVDPVFDCPLQGCFNGCTNFLCN